MRSACLQKGVACRGWAGSPLGVPPSMSFTEHATIKAFLWLPGKHVLAVVLMWTVGSGQQQIVKYSSSSSANALNRPTHPTPAAPGRSALSAR